MERAKQIRMQYGEHSTGRLNPNVIHHPTVLLIGRMVVLTPVMLSAGAMCGTTFLTSYMLRMGEAAMAGTVVFLYILAYLIAPILSIRLGCAGWAFSSATRKRDGLLMLVGTRIAKWVEASGWFAIWRTRTLGAILLLQSLVDLVCWLWNIARLVHATL